MDISDLIDRLNSYDGDNIWQDVIYDLDDLDVDGAATDRIDVGASDRFVADGVTYRWSEQDRTWAAKWA